MDLPTADELSGIEAFFDQIDDMQMELDALPQGEGVHTITRRALWGGEAQYKVFQMQQQANRLRAVGVDVDLFELELIELRANILQVCLGVRRRDQALKLATVGHTGVAI